LKKLSFICLGGLGVSFIPFMSFVSWCPIYQYRNVCLMAACKKIEGHTNSPPPLRHCIQRKTCIWWIWRVADVLWPYKVMDLFPLGGGGVEIFFLSLP
jgi:hypothetical protein